MAHENETPGQCVRLQPLAKLGPRPETMRLLRSKNVRVDQVVIPQGHELPEHAAEGELLLHCLEGRIAVNARGGQCELGAGELFHLASDQPFSTRAVENASFLMTVILPTHGIHADLIGE